MGVREHDGVLLSRMELVDFGKITQSGHTCVSRTNPPGHFLFGPFIRLEQGRYRLSLTCRVGVPRISAAPVLGLEILGQGRFQVAACDFLAGELCGPVQCCFDVTKTLSEESGHNVSFEFRLTHFANADIEILSMSLDRVGPIDIAVAHCSSWRLMGRLHRYGLPRSWGKALLSRQRWAVPGRILCNRCVPRLLLAAGRYRLTLRVLSDVQSLSDKSLIGVEVVTRDGGVHGQWCLAEKDVMEGVVSLDFEVPPELSIESGADACFDIRLTQMSVVGIQIASVDLQLLGTDAAASLQSSLPVVSIGALARARVVIVGNCQAAVIGNLFRSNDLLRRRFETRNHHVELSEALREQGVRDLERCDVMLVQDISDWNRYPLRDHVPDRVKMIRFPCLRFASLWPFDAFNGPDDRVARNHDHPNFEFTYFDGMLARLRRNVPDPVARLEAYRGLAMDHVVDCQRLHALEERRLLAMDATYGGDAGAYILDRFRNRQVFYTTAHPSGAVFERMIQAMLVRLDIHQRLRSVSELDKLRYLQVPIHPLVAERLNVPWAKEGATFLYRGRRLTWDAYFRHYIAHYG